MVTQFKHLNVPDQWEQYWTRYPQGYTILESLINWVSQVDLMTDNVNDWNKYLSDFVDTFDKKIEPTVRAMLREMDKDGRLAEIINKEIFADLNQKQADTVTLIRPTMTTPEIQSLLNKKGTFKFVKGTYNLTFLQGYTDATCLDVQSDSTLTFEKGAILKAPTNDLDRYYVLLLKDRHNVTIDGGVIYGDRKTHITTPSTNPNNLDGFTGEWGMGIAIHGSKNVNVLDTSIFDCWGDGIHIARSNFEEGLYAENIRIENYYSDNNRRQGISITSGKHIRIKDPIIKNTGGTRPGASIDIEPNNNNEIMEDIVIDNLYSENNLFGISIDFTNHIGATPKFIGVTVNNLTDVASQVGSQITRGSKDGILYGDIEINNPTFIKTQYNAFSFRWFGDDFAKVKINNPTVIDSNTRGSSVNLTAGAFIFRNSTTRPTGNVEIVEMDIQTIEGNKAPISLVVEGLKVKNLHIKNPKRLLENYLDVGYGQYDITDAYGVLTREVTSSTTSVGRAFSKLFTDKGTTKAVTLNLLPDVEFGSPEITIIRQSDYTITITPDAGSTIVPLTSTPGKSFYLAKGTAITLKRLDSKTWQVISQAGNVTLL